MSRDLALCADRRALDSIRLAASVLLINTNCIRSGGGPSQSASSAPAHTQMDRSGNIGDTAVYSYRGRDTLMMTWIRETKVLGEAEDVHGYGSTKSPHLSPSSTRLPHRYGNKDSSGSNLYLLLKGEAGDPRRVDGMYSISEQPGQVQVVEVRLLYPNDVPTGLHKFFKLDSFSVMHVGRKETRYPPYLTGGSWEPEEVWMLTVNCSVTGSERVDAIHVVVDTLAKDGARRHRLGRNCSTTTFEEEEEAATHLLPFPFSSF
ncbi:hypothetical protein F2P81_017595 [Scophthalmus maximus]|uniref:Uncharacterized protein n=1 Tax=Scophthalmus maximus TaxID=52904 RepID=A0A6A4SIS3_SCOMX|nr:hypothetical protein F2P81_017595 [Scophthalmus maximus]